MATDTQQDFDQLMRDYRRVVTERDRLQLIIDSRPAINAALPGSYVEWSQSIYAMDFAHARETPQ
jgi:hypothetical protein